MNDILQKNIDFIFVSVKRRKIQAGKVASWMYTAVTSVCVIIYCETACLININH